MLFCRIFFNRSIFWVFYFLLLISKKSYADYPRIVFHDGHSFAIVDRGTDNGFYDDDVICLFNKTLSEKKACGIIILSTKNISMMMVESNNLLLIEQDDVVLKQIFSKDKRDIKKQAEAIINRIRDESNKFKVVLLTFQSEFAIVYAGVLDGYKKNEKICLYSNEESPIDEKELTCTEIILANNGYSVIRVPEILRRSIDIGMQTKLEEDSKNEDKSENNLNMEKTSDITITDQMRRDIIQEKQIGLSKILSKLTSLHDERQERIRKKVANLTKINQNLQNKLISQSYIELFGIEAVFSIRSRSVFNKVKFPIIDVEDEQNSEINWHRRELVNRQAIGAAIRYYREISSFASLDLRLRWQAFDYIHSSTPYDNFNPNSMVSMAFRYHTLGAGTDIYFVRLGLDSWGEVALGLGLDYERSYFSFETSYLKGSDAASLIEEVNYVFDTVGFVFPTMYMVNLWRFYFYANLNFIFPRQSRDINNNRKEFSLFNGADHKSSHAFKAYQLRMSKVASEINFGLAISF